MIAEEVSWEEFEVAKGKTAIVVFGALEPHGKHLPLNTDTAIPWELAKRVEKKCDAVLFPPVSYGHLYSLKKYPGAVSLRFSTLNALALDVFSELVRNGIKRILVLIGHSGNAGPVKEALKELSEREEFRACVIEWWHFIDVQAGHADECEGSMVLAAGGKLRKEPEQEGRSDYVGYIIPTPEDLFTPSGYMGSVGDIRKERGEEWMESISDRLAGLVKNDLLVKK